jgi:capsule polysaccharide export protein KpsE/RkpR
MGNNAMGGEGALGNLAQSFGIDLNNMSSGDAISPLLYPDLMGDNGFVARLFNIRIKTADDSLHTTYYDYLDKHQKKSPWEKPVNWVMSLIPKDEPVGGGKGSSEFDPYHMSKHDTDIAGAIRSCINITVDKQTAVITISVKAQDPLVCKTLADSVRTHLQEFITEYRTKKALVDLEYYQKLAADAKADYEKARRLYGSYADANTDLVLESFRAKQEDLENDMQLKYNTYTMMSSQLQNARAKVQERTPAFTTVVGASVPVKPSEPKRMLFVLGMMFLTFFGCVLYILKDNIKESIVGEETQKEEKKEEKKEEE